MLLLCNCWLWTASSNFCKAEGSHSRCWTGLHKLNTQTDRQTDNYVEWTLKRWVGSAEWQCKFKALDMLCFNMSVFTVFPTPEPDVFPAWLTPVDLCLCVCAFCVAVLNPCADQNGGCMHECRVDGGKAHCNCKVGYILAEDKKTCEGKFTVWHYSHYKCS